MNTCTDDSTDVVMGQSSGHRCRGPVLGSPLCKRHRSVADAGIRGRSHRPSELPSALSRAWLQISPYKCAACAQDGFAQSVLPDSPLYIETAIWDHEVKRLISEGSRCLSPSTSPQPRARRRRPRTRIRLLRSGGSLGLQPRKWGRRSPFVVCHRVGQTIVVCGLTSPWGNPRRARLARIGEFLPICFASQTGVWRKRPPARKSRRTWNSPSRTTPSRRD